LPILDNLEALVDLADRAGGRERPGLLALDVSKRAIGAAGAAPSWRRATPLRTIRRHRLAQDLAALGAIVRERDARALVIGWPLNMDGSEGPRCQSVRAFAHSLDAALGLPMLLWDERLTTFAAEEVAADAGLRGSKRSQTLDALAAATILQDTLNAVARLGQRASPRKP
jgi:putative Holliday junction resolvase